MNNFNEPFSTFLEEIIKAFAPYAQMATEIQETMKPLVKELSTFSKKFVLSFYELRKSLEPLISRVKEIEQEYGSVTNYFNKLIEDRHRVLAQYGWFYAFGISDQLADEVFSRQDALTQEIADTMVTDFFNSDGFAELEAMVVNWKHSAYFTSRQHIFDEAVANHKQRRFYSAVTLLSVHTEGLISDYIRVNKSSKYRLEGYVNDLYQTLTENSNHIKFSDIEKMALFDFLTDVFTSSFSPENPELQDAKKTNGVEVASHNLSRHKISHGHVFEGLSEADSLKCFLYLNGLFHLFNELEQEDES